MSIDINAINTVLASEDHIDLIFGTVERDLFKVNSTVGHHTFHASGHYWTVVDCDDSTQLCSGECLASWAADAQYPTMVMADVESHHEVWAVPHYVDPETSGSAVAHPFHASDQNPGYDVECSQCGQLMFAGDTFAAYVNAAFPAYLETALWSTMGFDSDGIPGAPLEESHDVDDIDPDALDELRDDVIRFIADNWTDVRDLDAAQVGHDFWLTREGHGAGFWDRGLGELGDRLTAAAHAYGGCDLYVGDDGAIYC